MTIQIKNENSSDDNVSEEEYIDIVNETIENCDKYLNEKECLIRAEDEKIYHIKLLNNNRIGKILTSPLIVRGLPWKLYIIQNNKLGNNERMLSISVICDIPGDNLWSCIVKCNVTLINIFNSDKNIVRTFSTLFTYKDKEYIINDLVNMKDLYCGNSKYVLNGYFDMKLYINADPPRGLSWDSRKLSGYIGLINQGATCYLNSLLQTLYFAAPLKRIIFMTPTETDNRVKSVVLALQYTFMDLYYSDICVDTKKLTNSFGWAPTEVYVQRDVQEMCRLLIDNIENKTKGTIVDGEIAKLLEGKITVTIKCLNVNYVSKRMESFYDIQLSVKNVKNIYEALDQYCADECLKDDNKYYAQDYGLQDAVKSIKFSSLPPLLHLHLLRFIVNMQTYNYEKVYDRFEFYKTINLSKYLDNSSNGNINYGNEIYYLQSVLVHCGSSNGGHYIAYVSPNCDSNWFKFDDDIVSIVTEEEAINNTFGITNNDIRSCSTYTAYMLLYINSLILNDEKYKFTECDIPEYLKNIYIKEKQYQQNEIILNNNRQNIIEIPLIYDDILFLSLNCTTIDFSSIKPYVYYMPSECSFSDIVKAIYKQTGYDKIRIWILKENSNNLIRPIYLYDDLYIHPLKKVVNKIQFPLFIENISDDNSTFNKDENILLFIHTFDNIEQKIYYHGMFIVDRNDKICNIIVSIFNKLNMQYNINSLIYIENDPYSLQLVDNNLFVNQFIPSDCDSEFIIIQNNYDLNVALTDSEYPFHYAHQYVQQLTNMYRVSFIDILSPNDEPSFVLDLCKKVRIFTLISLIAERCQVDQKYIRLYKHRMTTTAGCSIKSDFNGTLLELFSSLSRSSDHQKLYFQILYIPINIIENKIMNIIRYITSNNQEGLMSIFRNSNEKTYNDFIKLFLESSKLCKLNINNPIRIICFERQILHILYPTYNKFEDYLDESCSRKIRIEEIPQYQLNTNIILISVNIKIKNNQTYLLNKSFFVGILPYYTYQDIINNINTYHTNNNCKNLTYSIYHIKNKTNHLFPNDHTQLFPIHLLGINTNNIPSNDNVVDTSTIVIELTEPNTTRFFRSDPSFKIHN